MGPQSGAVRSVLWLTCSLLGSLSTQVDPRNKDSHQESCSLLTSLIAANLFVPEEVGSKGNKRKARGISGKVIVCMPDLSTCCH